MSSDYTQVLSQTVGAVGSLIGAYNSYKGQEKANKQSAREADINRQWQEQMSNTAHQREVEDLRKAGLNPLLSVNKGATTGSPVMPQLKNPMEGVSSMIGSTAKALKELALLNSLIKTEKAKQADLESSRRQRNSATDLNKWTKLYYRQGFAPYMLRSEFDASSTGMKLYKTNQVARTIGQISGTSRNIVGGLKGMVK